MDPHQNPEVDGHRLGRILLENPIVRQEDLQRCLEIQALTGNSRMLGQILVEEGILTYEMLEELLRVQTARRTHTPEQGVDGPVTALESESYLETAVRMGASDLYICEGRPVTLRVAGSLRRVTEGPIAPPEIWELVKRLFGAKALDQLADTKSIDASFSRPGIGHGRVHAYRHFEGIGLAIRLHPEAPRTFDSAGLPAELKAALQPGKGFVLVAGEARSGISETLAICLAEVCKDPNRIVLVLDEAFERPAPSGGAIVVRRRVGTHTKSYAAGLRAATRELPDVVVVGNVSDPEAFDLALRVAESGRLVIAGYRARSVTVALQSACEGFPVHERARARVTLASLLRCAFAQQLVPDQKRTTVVLAHEILRANDAVRDVLRDGNFAQLALLLRLNKDFGTSMDASLVHLWKSGRIVFEDAFACAEDKAHVMGTQKETRPAQARSVTAVLESFEKSGKGV